MKQDVMVSAVDGLELHTYRWTVENPRATVQIAHGLAEHAQRYDRLAQELMQAGFDVWSHDHRGHGASVNENVPLGSFGVAGWDGLVADLVQFSEYIESTSAGVPHFLLGHSMGSFATQFAILDHSSLYRGVTLSGTSALDIAAASMPAPGDQDEAAGLDAFNTGFQNRTGYEWLSRDESEVDKYVADPLCGFDVDASVLPSIFGAGGKTADPEALARISPDLSILVMSGQDDPLAGQGYMPRTVAERYEAAGVRDVELEIYPGARHEIFNETNRGEVTKRYTSWLETRAV